MTRILDSPLTSKLKLNIAIQLLDSFIDSEYNRFFAGEQFDKEELENLLRAVNFWEYETGKVKGYRVAIANQIEKYGN
jgi:hypothetical protein